MASKSLTESRKSLRFNSVYYEDLDNYDDNDDADMMMINIERLEALEDYLKGLIAIIINLY